jgi:hypothetical protein
MAFQRLATLQSLTSIDFTLPNHEPTIAIGEILDRYDGDDRDDVWESIKAYADVHARAALEATPPADAALADARAKKPVAYMHNKRADVIHTSVKSLLSDFAVNSGPESMLRPIDKSEHYTIPLYAAPVPAQPAVPDFIPALYSWLARAHFDNQQDEVTASRFGQQLHAWITAQPSAVSEAVAKDAALSGKEFDALLILLMCSDPWPVGDEANENTMKALATRVAKQYGHDDWIAAYHNHAPTDAALLSAADTEVKNG